MTEDSEASRPAKSRDDEWISSYPGRKGAGRAAGALLQMLSTRGQTLLIWSGRFITTCGGRFPSRLQELELTVCPSRQHPHTHNF